MLEAGGSQDEAIAGCGDSTAGDKEVPDTLTIPLQLAVEGIAEHISQKEG